MSRGSEMKRIVITGIGPLTARSSGREEFWQSLLAGELAPGSPAGLHVRDERIISPEDPKLRHADRVSRLTLTVVGLALADAGLEPGAEGLGETGLSFGSGFGCVASNAEYLHAILTRGPRFGNPVVFQNTVPNAGTGYASAAYRLLGPTATFCSGELAGFEALEFGFQQIAEEICPSMVAGGAEELSSWVTELFNARGEISPSGAARPFGRRRDGVVLGEGGCALVIEELEQAERRGARIYAEVLAIGGGSAGGGQTSAAVVSTVGGRLRDCGLSGADLDLVFSSGSGSVERDLQEAEGLRGALGERAWRLPMICPKGALGETVGGSGSLLVAAAALALWSGQVPPTVRSADPDPDLYRALPDGEVLGREPRVALVSALGEDGNAFAAVLRRYEP